MRPRTVVLAVVAFATFGVAVALLRGPWQASPSPTPSGAGAVPDSVQLPSTAIAPAGETRASRSREPGVSVAEIAALPPPGADPGYVVRSLLAAADAGHKRARCRVAIELVTCSHAAALRGERFVRGDLAGTFGAEFAEQQARMDAEIAAVDERCAAIPAATRARSASLLAAAAHAGDPDAVLLFAQGAHIDGMSSHGFIAHPAFEQWRAQAVPLLSRLFRSGNRQAVLLLAMSSFDDFSALSGLVAKDRVRARAYWLLNEMIQGRTGTKILRGTPEQEREAAALAARWHRDHFGGRVTVDEPGALTGPPAPWIEGFSEPLRCVAAPAW